MAPKLPLDIFELIVEITAQSTGCAKNADPFRVDVGYSVKTSVDLSILLVCTKVNRAFWFLARRHIFRNISLIYASDIHRPFRMALGLLDLMVDDTLYPITPLIHSFSVSLKNMGGFNDTVWKTLIPVLEKLRICDYLHSLSFSAYPYHIRWLDAARQGFEAAFYNLFQSPTLIELKLSGFLDLPSDIFHQDRMASIQLLTNRDCYHDCTHASQNISPPPLTSLTTDGKFPFYDIYFKGNSTNQPTSRIKTLSITVLSKRHTSHEIEALQIISASSHSLENLRFDLFHNFPGASDTVELADFDLANSPNLRSLNISCRIPRGTYQFPMINKICNTFLYTSIVIKSFTCLTLTFITTAGCDDGPVDSFKIGMGDHWRYIDKTVSQHRFSSLRRMELKLTFTLFEIDQNRVQVEKSKIPELQKRLRQCLPSLAASDSIEFVVTVEVEEF